MLLGHRDIDDRSWFVYLVGMVEYRGWIVAWPLDQPRVVDIRLIALSKRAGEFMWLATAPDANALEQYCLPQREQWRRSDPGRGDATDTPSVFPTDADAFQMTVEDAAVTVVDRRSAAQWTLRLRPPQASPRPSS